VPRALHTNHALTAPSPQAAGGYPLISVVICTLNRARLLRNAMASVVGQDFPRWEYEIVVVDNGSTDETPEVVAEFHDRAQIQYLREERIGLCIARNTGWSAAEGRYIAFFDDDAIARPGWLMAIRRGFEEETIPRIGIIGGRVEPRWERSRPSWLANEIAGSLTIVDWGPVDKIITDIQSGWFAGVNMAIPKAILIEIGGFHPWLDRVGPNLLSNGDVFLQKEIMRRGFCGRYVPNMAVDHVVPLSRLTQRWFRRRFFWQGVSDAVMCLIENKPSLLDRLCLSLSRMAHLIRSWRHLKALMVPTELPQVFSAKCFALIDIGFVLGLLGIARH
jgi:glycosyltransferase involved in cell wall biosynthesis